MSDLAGRLRTWAEFTGNVDERLPSTLREAADEIDKLRAEKERLRAALEAFVDYYDQAGIGDCNPSDEDDRDDGFDGDEVFNVRMGRAALASLPKEDNK